MKTPKVTIRKKLNQRVGIKDGIKVGINQMQKQIIETVLKDAAITAQKLSEVIGMSQRKIENNISDLKAKGILERKGSRKLKYWEINQ